VRYLVSQMQYLPSEEPILYTDLEMEMRFNKPLFITKNAAKEDTERLFYLLENGYAGYGYFNTENRFQSAKNDILNELDTKIVLTPSDLSGIFYKHLNFLHDCHLKIGDQSYKAHLDYWYNTEFEFTKENQDYIFSYEGKSYKVTAINKQSPDDFMYPSFNSEGESIFHIGLLSRTSPDVLELLAESNGESGRWSVALEKTEHVYPDLYMEKVVGGVPVVRIRTFSDQHIEYISQFLESASKYQDSPCLIVDIRGNGGGNTAYARQWITRYTGETPVLPQIYTELVSETSMMGRSNYFAHSLSMYPELEAQGYDLKAEEFKGYAEKIENNKTSIHWSDYTVPNPRTITNNRTLIVLMDKYVGSAAEGFLSYLQLVENVVFIGENSGGALTYGQMTRHMLPNSRILVDLPISLNVFVDLEYREEKGFYPDVWVSSMDALNYAVAAVRYGSIETSDGFIDEIRGIEFIPEPKMVSSSLPQLLLILFGLFYGVIIVYFNRNRGYITFLIGGIIAILIGGFIPINRELGLVFLIAGLEYLVIAAYKWRKTIQEK
ncbi:MAG: S41 family peptidase, partial [Candidatus Bathyarchaeota archaeon]|nr:S41 family peptidase [Candidatus Bathyarchaeota archaeon]